MTLDGRLRALLVRHGAVDKRMFGGTCFLMNGNMAIGTLKDGLIVRVGKAAHSQALKRPGAGTFDMMGRLMEGFVSVQESAVADDAALDAWVDLVLAFVRTLPAKEAKPARAKRRGPGE